MKRMKLRNNVHRCYDADCPDAGRCDRFLQRRPDNLTVQSRSTFRDRRTGECDMFIEEGVTDDRSME